MKRRVRIALAGDVMLGRAVDEAVRRVGDPAYVWGNTLGLLRAADLGILNLECVVASPETGRRRVPKTFHFKAFPWAIEALRAAEIDAVSLANNHVLDYQEEAFLEMISRLDAVGIAHSGGGASLAEAVRPAIVSARGLRVALVALTDNEPEWEATENTPGTFYVPLETRGERFEKLLATIGRAAAMAEVVVVSAHVGPHMRESPGPEYVAFARAIIEAGAHVYMGTSNHTFQGIEIYRGRPILYDLGDFVDDYAVDPVMRNDWSFLFLVDFDERGSRRLWLVPTAISNMQVNLAKGRLQDRILTRMERLCRELGTPTRRVPGRLSIAFDH